MNSNKKDQTQQAEHDQSENEEIIADQQLSNTDSKSGSQDIQAGDKEDKQIEDEEKSRCEEFTQKKSTQNKDGKIKKVQATTKATEAALQKPDKLANNRKANEMEQELAPEPSDSDSAEDDTVSQEYDHNSDCESLEDIFDEGNEEIANCKTKKDKMLDAQEELALEELIKEYGIDQVCFTCITGYSQRKNYEQHMRTRHNSEAYEQGLGKFTCKYCDMLLTTKRKLLAHIKRHEMKEKKGKNPRALSTRQQKIVDSYSSQSNIKKRIIQKMKDKNKK